MQEYLRHQMNTKLFPTIIIILMVIASGICFWKHEIKQSIFWLSLAVANSCVTY
jgi:hypothetical protein